MVRAKAKSVYRCRECGHQAAKWLGRCPGCEAWNTFDEERLEVAAKGRHGERTFRLPDGALAQPTPLANLAVVPIERALTGISEFDRVLGGGLVPGALILVGGDPGIGKSTLLLQALDGIARRQSNGAALYVTGEESPEQVKLRAARLGVEAERLLLFAETRADRIIEAATARRPSVLAVDSVQAVYDPEIESAPGSVTQVREVSARLLYLAKAHGIPTFLIGHVTKDGNLAGPRVLEHMVDTVLYFESSTNHAFRILRAHKNRFGSTNEIGVFEMAAEGLKEVTNPSELFLAERPRGVPGSVVLPAMEGSRPVLMEVQALVSPTNFGTPRRTCLGFDANRAALLMAVLERRAGLDLLGFDAFVNVAGGMEITEPAADLAVASALASSLRNRAMDPRTIVFGEVGLAGELRAVTQAEHRLHEALKLGFARAVIPAANLRKLQKPAGFEVIGAQSLAEALDRIFDDGTNNERSSSSSSSSSRKQ